MPGKKWGSAAPKYQGAHWLALAKRLQLLARDGYQCAWCGVVVLRAEASDRLTIDHLFPRERWRRLSEREQERLRKIDGRLRKGINDQHNLVTCCLHCNDQKRHLTAREFLAYLRKRGQTTAACARRIRLFTARALKPLSLEDMEECVRREPKRYRHFLRLIERLRQGLPMRKRNPGALAEEGERTSADIHNFLAKIVRLLRAGNLEGAATAAESLRNAITHQREIRDAAEALPQRDAEEWAKITGEMLEDE